MRHFAVELLGPPNPLPVMVTVDGISTGRRRGEAAKSFTPGCWDSVRGGSNAIASSAPDIR